MYFASRFVPAVMIGIETWPTLSDWLTILAPEGRLSLKLYFAFWYRRPDVDPVVDVGVGVGVLLGTAVVGTGVVAVVGTAVVATGVVATGVVGVVGTAVVATGVVAVVGTTVVPVVGTTVVPVVGTAVVGPAVAGEAPAR